MIPYERFSLRVTFEGLDDLPAMLFAINSSALFRMRRAAHVYVNAFMCAPREFLRMITSRMHLELPTRRIGSSRTIRAPLCMRGWRAALTPSTWQVGGSQRVGVRVLDPGTVPTIRRAALRHERALRVFIGGARLRGARK